MSNPAHMKKGIFQTGERVSERQLTLICTIGALAVVVLVCLLQAPKYATVDDFVQNLYVRGDFLNSSTMLMPYSLVAFSAPVSVLYAILPFVPWFPLIMFAMVWASFTLVLRLALEGELPFVCRLMFAIALLAVEFMVCVYFSYTIVAFVAFGAGAAHIIARAGYEKPGRLRLSDLLAYVLVLEGFSLRPESGAAAALLFVPFIIWMLTHNRNSRTIVMALAVVACMTFSYVSGNLAYSLTSGWEDYTTSFRAVQSVVDYPELNYETVSGVTDLSENDLKMLYEFLFQDTSTFDLATIQALSAEVQSYSLSTCIESILSRKTFTIFVLGLMVIIMACTALVVRARSLRGAGKALVWSVPVMGALEFLVIFLRARVLMHVVLPIFAVSIFAVVLAARVSKGRSDGAERNTRGVQAVSTMGAIVFVALAIFVEIWYALPLQNTTLLNATENVQSYVDENPDKLVLFAYSQGLLTNSDCFSFEQWDYPDNVVFLSGYDIYTSTWADFLDREGLSLDDFYLNLCNDNWVTVTSEEYAELLATYLSEHLNENVSAHQLEDLGASSTGVEYYVWSFS